jgi:hypothetical protein
LAIRARWDKTRGKIKFVVKPSVMAAGPINSHPVLKITPTSNGDPLQSPRQSGESIEVPGKGSLTDKVILQSDRNIDHMTKDCCESVFLSRSLLEYAD